MDIIVSLLMLVILFPVFLLLFLTNLFFLGRPIFFLQERIGQKKILFTIIKFRTMPIHKENSMPQKCIISPYGLFLRKYSLDEIPSFWNVLIGHMSLVGPRPLCKHFFCPIWRCSMKPGLTGLAQISGRNALTWREKFRYDSWYNQHFSIRKDLWILWKTISILFKNEGTELAKEENYFPKTRDDCRKK